MRNGADYLLCQLQILFSCLASVAFSSVGLKLWITFSGSVSSDQSFMSRSQFQTYLSLKLIVSTIGTLSLSLRLALSLSLSVSHSQSYLFEIACINHRLSVSFSLLPCLSLSLSLPRSLFLCILLSSECC